MPHEHTPSDQAPVTIAGHFADRRTAELAAQAALSNGFMVQCLDKTVTLRVVQPELTVDAEGLLGAYGPINLPELDAPIRGSGRIQAD